MARFVGLLCFLAVACASASSKVISNAASTSRIQSEYLISVRPNIMRGQSLKQSMDTFVQKMATLSEGISVISRSDFTKLSVLHIKADSEVVVASMYSFPEVASIEANLEEYALDQCVTQTGLTRESGLWGLARIAKRQEANDPTYTYGSNDGAGSYVYIVDAGIRISHNDYGGRAIHGYTHPDIISGGDGDQNGHGTHCAGTVMASTYGVAKAAGAIAVKVLDNNGVGTTARTIDGLNWIQNDFAARDAAAGGNFPAVVSMSLRFEPSDAMDAVLQELFDAGLITTASAGNQATESCFQSPARAAASVAVMASDWDNVLADFSSFGVCADVIAPGVTVRSTYINHDDSFWTLSGTSMSCPHAAGLLLRRMTQVIAATGSRPSPAALKDWIKNTATSGVINIRNRPNTNNLFIYAPCNL